MSTAAERGGAVRTLAVREGAAPGDLRLETAGSLVTANHHLAAAAGARLLAAGGNAVDAAVATAFAAGVVEPAMSGLGGRGYCVVLEPGSVEPLLFDGHDRAPRAARPEMFERLPASASREGHLAVAVPGVLRALHAAHERCARLPWASALEPAIELAADGVEVDATLARLLDEHRAKLACHESTAATFFAGGRPLRDGERLVQHDLARSLELIARDGADAFYDGPIARAIVAEMERGGGILSASDLREIEARAWPAALAGTYREHRLVGMPDATGSSTLLEIMNLLEALEPPADEPTALHLLLEAFRAAFEDRLRHVDDGSFADVPFARLVSKEFAAARAATIVAGRHTTHFCAVDGDRRVVSMTQSIIDPFGSGVTVAGTGILLNDAMSNFELRAGRLRSIEPWKRPAHYGTPLVVLDPEGSPRLALGGAGGTRIVTGLAQVLRHLIDGGASLDEAIAAPRVHAEGAERSEVDSRFAPATLDELRRRGHAVELVEARFAAPGFARLNGIAIGADGTLAAGVEPFVEAGAAAVDPAPAQENRGT